VLCVWVGKNASCTRLALRGSQFARPSGAEAAGAARASQPAGMCAARAVVTRKTGTWSAIASNSSKGAWRSTGMWARAPGAAGEVPAQDRPPSWRIDVLEAHSFSAAMTQDGATTGRPHVENPVRVLAEHRYEIALAFVLCDHHRKRNDAARAPSRHLKRRETGRPDPRRVSYCRAPVQQPRQAVRPTAPLQPSKVGLVQLHNAPPSPVRIIYLDGQLALMVVCMPLAKWLTWLPSGSVSTMLQNRM
jgi:hypothetical protein